MRKGLQQWARQAGPPILGFVIIISLWWWMWGACANPLNVSCFVGPSKGDHLQHYYAWQTYAQGATAQALPPAFDNWTWPFSVPLIYGDPIPLAAVLMRPIQGWIGRPIQYFSICILLNMLVTFGCALWVGEKTGLKAGAATALGIVLSTSGMSLLRLRGHEALAMQGLLVMAITLVIGRVRTAWAWGLLIVISLGVHAYFLPMILMLWLFQLLVDATESKKKWRSVWISLKQAAMILAAVVIGAVAWGYVPNRMDVALTGELWTANILAPIDSQGMSPIAPAAPSRMPYQWEGYCYLGIGGLGMIASAIAAQARRRRHETLTERAPGENRQEASIFPAPRLYLALMLAFCIFAIGEPIYIGSHLLSASNPTYAFAGNLPLIFRATGRYTWVAAYSLLIWAYCSIARRYWDKSRPRAIIVTLVVILILESNLGVAHRIHQILERRQASTAITWGQTVPSSLIRAVKEADYIINTTGNPGVTAKELPRFAIQAINPTTRTNYAPYLARLPRGFTEYYTNNECTLIQESTRMARHESGDDTSILLITNEGAERACRELQLIQVHRLSDDLSMMRPSQPSVENTKHSRVIEGL